MQREKFFILVIRWNASATAPSIMCSAWWTCRVTSIAVAVSRPWLGICNLTWSWRWLWGMPGVSKVSFSALIIWNIKEKDKMKVYRVYCNYSYFNDSNSENNEIPLNDRFLTVLIIVEEFSKINSEKNITSYYQQWIFDIFKMMTGKNTVHLVNNLEKSRPRKKNIRVWKLSDKRNTWKEKGVKRKRKKKNNDLSLRNLNNALKNILYHANYHYILCFISISNILNQKYYMK